MGPDPELADVRAILRGPNPLQASSALQQTIGYPATRELIFAAAGRTDGVLGEVGPNIPELRATLRPIVLRLLQQIIGDSGTLALLDLVVPFDAAPVSQPDPTGAAAFREEMARLGITSSGSPTVAADGPVTPQPAEDTERHQDRPGPAPSSSTPKPRTPSTTVPYREEMEQAFGTSFAGVATHLGEQDALAPFGARAAAWSETIAFTSQTPDCGVIAHELAHVEQLRHAGGNAPDAVSRSGDSSETEAARIATAVSSGATKVQATTAPTGAVAFDRGSSLMHGELLPGVASRRIESFSVLARIAIYDVDHDVNAYTMLRNVERAAPAELYRWALELQSVPHGAYSNYLRAWYYAVAADEPARALAIGQRLADRGVDFGVSAGSFSSFEHTDPAEPLPSSMAPEVARLPIGRGVDYYQNVKYDSAYRAAGGRLSTILQLRYADGATLDLDFELISDNVEPAPFQAFARSYVGPAGRVFPLRLDRATTPRLYVAKQAALKKIAEENLDFENFVSIGLAGILSNLPAGPVVGPEPASGPTTDTQRRTPNRTPVADRAREPVAARPAPVVHETSTVTNHASVIPPAQVIERYQPGTVFSGVYNPEKNTFVALPSEGATLVDGSPAPHTVPRRGGHGPAEEALMRATGTTDRSKNVGFTLTWGGNRKLRINWVSGQVNSRNFPEAARTRIAPESVRGPIVQAIQSSTGFEVLE